MKKKIPSVKKAIPSIQPKAKRAVRRKRQSGVRQRIIDIISAGPIGRSALEKKGSFTPSALHLHLVALTKEGVIKRRKEGRSVILSMKGKTAGVSASQPIEGDIVTALVVHESVAALPVSVRSISPELQAALSAVTNRLSPIEQIEEKLIVLDRLARAMPPSLSSVLHSVMQDLAKASGL